LYIASGEVEQKLVPLVVPQMSMPTGGGVLCTVTATGGETMIWPPA